MDEDDPKRIDKLGKDFEQMKRYLPEYLEYQEIMAKLQRKRFEELVKAGFTEAQALVLCQKVG